MSSELLWGWVLLLLWTEVWFAWWNSELRQRCTRWLAGILYGGCFVACWWGVCVWRMVVHVLLCWWRIRGLVEMVWVHCNIFWKIMWWGLWCIRMVTWSVKWRYNVRILVFALYEWWREFWWVRFCYMKERVLYVVFCDEEWCMEFIVYYCEREYIICGWYR